MKVAGCVPGNRTGGIFVQRLKIQKLFPVQLLCSAVLGLGGKA